MEKKKIIIKNLAPYYREDKKLQERQNKLLMWTIWLTILGVVAQIGEIIASVYF